MVAGGAGRTNPQWARLPAGGSCKPGPCRHAPDQCHHVTPPNTTQNATHTQSRSGQGLECDLGLSGCVGSSLPPMWVGSARLVARRLRRPAGHPLLQPRSLSSNGFAGIPQLQNPQDWSKFAKDAEERYRGWGTGVHPLVDLVLPGVGSRPPPIGRFQALVGCPQGGAPVGMPMPTHPGPMPGS